MTRGLVSLRPIWYADVIYVNMFVIWKTFLRCTTSLQNSPDGK